MEMRATFEELARSHAPEALEILMKVARKGVTDSARVTAASVIIERGYGKPIQRIEEGKPGDFDKMSDDDLKKFIQERIRNLGLSHEKVGAAGRSNGSGGQLH